MYIPILPSKPFRIWAPRSAQSAHDLETILVILRAPSQMEYTIRHMVVFNSKAYANI